MQCTLCGLSDKVGYRIWVVVLMKNLQQCNDRIGEGKGDTGNNKIGSN